MRKVKVLPVTFLILVCLSFMPVACSNAEPVASSTPPAEQTLAAETPVTEATAPAAEETPEGAESESAETPTPTSSGLTAVIVSGDSAGIGKPFTFDATQSKAGAAAIVNYVWTLGDGTTLFGISVEHAYRKLGFYTVNLIITDADGQTDTAAKVVEIIDLEQTATPAPEGEFPVVGTIWELDNAIRGTTVTLAFEEESLSGSAGCNDYDATYSITNGATAGISISFIRAGNKSCTSEVMAQERGYLESLSSAATISVDGDTLRLETGQGTLVFSRVSN